jgi:hypothetical protein
MHFQVHGVAAFAMPVVSGKRTARSILISKDKGLASKTLDGKQRFNQTDGMTRKGGEAKKSGIELFLFLPRKP